MGTAELRKIAARYLETVAGKRDIVLKQSKKTGAEATLFSNGRESYIQIRFQNKATIRGLYALLHEIAHVTLGHLDRESSESQDEYEAETWAMRVMDREGVPMSQSMLSTVKRDVAEAVIADLRAGLKVDPRAVELAGDKLTGKLRLHKGLSLGEHK